jgi:hypothetical protein
MKKPKQANLSAIGARMLSQEIAVSCLFETFARTQPNIALEVAQAMRRED